MGSLKTILVCVLAPVLLASGAVALPFSPSERVKVFAQCAGRLSALEEHQRLFDGAASERTAQRKRLFDEVIGALIDDAVADGMPRRQALHWQVDAKMAQHVLLQQAYFGTDTRRATLAQQAANTYLNSCDGLLLGA